MRTLMLAIAAGVTAVFLAAGPLRHAGQTAQAIAVMAAVGVAGAIDTWCAYRKRKRSSR